ncbi:g10905 [Coccomyxa viridis]|uniref:G10905 protein n=1 Tax=Coccomyxa viridis TaxID=1274662 RepID=A0ABP1GB23_9CHLO
MQKSHRLHSAAPPGPSGVGLVGRRTLWGFSQDSRHHQRSEQLHPAGRSAQVQTATASPSTPAAVTQIGEQRKEYDVYVNDPQPLDEGEEKHVISAFVADESGMINRVAGVFARRGANIESLAVGLNIDKALFTISITGRASTVVNLVKQLQKLVKVRYVEDITDAERVERELVLLKIRAPPGPTRTEVMQLIDIFRARVVDVSDRSLTIAVTGDAGKTAALQGVLTKFGVIEIARTGKIALKRGEHLLEMGGWGDGVAKRAKDRQNVNIGEDGAQVSTWGVGYKGEQAPEGADVYTVTNNGRPGVWDVSNVLEATYQKGDFEPHTLSIEVEDVPGVLNQVTGVFARRGYNVQSLAVGNSEVEGQSRITMVIPGSAEGTSKIVKQLNKLVNVQQVKDLSSKPYVARELMLIKVRCNASQRRELSDLADIFHGTVCDVSLTTITLELQGKEDKMHALQGLLEPYGILEVARTGRVALARDSGVDSRYLGRHKSRRIML